MKRIPIFLSVLLLTLALLLPCSCGRRQNTFRIGVAQCDDNEWRQRMNREMLSEALKLADEIGAAAAARRLGINEDTLYGWRGRQKKQRRVLEEELGGRSEAELLAEIKRLKSELQQARADVEILQEAVGFFAKSRKK